MKTYSYKGKYLDTITVNLNDMMQCESMAYLDENNMPGIGKWIEKNGLGVPMYVTGRSGFCSYPLYTLFVPEA